MSSQLLRRERTQRRAEWIERAEAPPPRDGRDDVGREVKCIGRAG